MILVLVLAVTSLDPLDTGAGGGGGTSLTISDCEEILSDAHLGDSICVNGTYVCLQDARAVQCFPLSPSPPSFEVQTMITKVRTGAMICRKKERV